MEITLAQLISIAPSSKPRASVFLAPLNAAMKEFEIDASPARIAAFLAQILHESGSLLYTEEIASGASYNGRKDLGNTHPGWGELYKGRGLIQITGYYNYTAVMMALGIDCVEHPEILKEPVNACRSAAWFWKDRNLSSLADQNTDEAFIKITKRVNGGTNGLQDRISFYHRAKEILNV
jgi:putative chitinase